MTKTLPIWNIQPTFKRPIIIFDGDETLYSGNHLRGRKVDIKIRPGAAELLRECHEHADLCLWTAASEDWAETMLEALGDVPWQMRWNRQRCTPQRNWETGEIDYAKKLQKLKPALKKAGLSRAQVLIVDDRSWPWKCALGNLLHIPAWHGNPEDTALLHVHREIQRLRTHKAWHRTAKCALLRPRI